MNYQVDTTENYRQLGFRIAEQAMKDFFEYDENTTYGKKARKQVIKDLRTPRLRLFTNDLSAILADKLETNPAEIEERLKWQKHEEE